jgi:anti-anti-sigma factor
MATFTATTSVDGDVVHLALVGSADLGAEPDLAAAATRISAMHPKHVVVDLSKLTMIASLAVGQLLQMLRGIKNRGGRMTIAAPTPEVRDVLVRCRMHDLVPFVASIEDATAR